jgi:hypothetical protein
MAEEVKKTETEATVSTGATVELTVDEKIAKAKEETKKEIDLAWQRKFDQKNTELQKKIAEAEELKKAKMTDDEKREFERQEKDRLLAEKEAAINARELENTKLLKMNEKALPIEFKDYISGSSVEDVEKKIDGFKVLFDAAVSKEVETRMRSGSAAPQNSGGSQGTGNLEAQLQIAIKNKDTVSQLKIQRQIDEAKKKTK